MISAEIKVNQFPSIRLILEEDPLVTFVKTLMQLTKLVSQIISL